MLLGNGDGSEGLGQSASRGTRRPDRSTHSPAPKKPPTAPSALEQLIVSVIIPQLGHASELTSRSIENVQIPANDVEQFCNLAVASQGDQLQSMVDEQLARGVSAETICLDLLAPLARRLGEDWVSDKCDFVEVTAGIGRLQELMRAASLADPSTCTSAKGADTALFAPLPGDQHSFGTVMVHEFFDRAGWQAQLMLDCTSSELIARVKEQAFDLVGLTISNDCSSGHLAKLIGDLRAASINPNIQILLGGRVATECREILAEVGADGIADDAHSALVLAKQLVSQSGEMPAISA